MLRVTCWHSLALRGARNGTSHPTPWLCGQGYLLLGPRDHTGGPALSSQGHRDSQTWERAQCLVSWADIVLFYRDVVNRSLWFLVF